MFCGVVFGALRPEPSAAQDVTARVDLFETTRLDWRGIRRNAHWATQADAWLVAGTRGWSFGAGAWTSLELSSTLDEPRPDLRAGPPGPTQWSLWGQLGYRRQHLVLTAGVIRDWYVRPDNDPATTEAYVAGRLQAGRWSGSLALWESLDGVEGAYLEPAVSFHHLANPFAGPAVPGAEGTGFSHAILDSHVRAAFHLVRDVTLVAMTGPQLRFNRDSAVKRGRDGAEADVRFWWPLQAGVSFPIPRRR
jgi:hypothetical protein